MSTALFDEPPRVSIGEGYLCRNGLLLGLRVGSTLDGVVLLEDGSITLLPVTVFTVDWRYNVLTDKWADIDARETTQTDQGG